MKLNPDLKAHGRKLVKSSDGNDGTPWSYLCDNGLPIEQCFVPNYFSTLKDLLLPGDTIEILQIKLIKGKVREIQAACKAIVISRSENAREIDVQMYDPKDGIHRYTPYGVVEEEIPEEPLVPIMYIEGSGRVERDEKTKIYTVYCNKDMIYQTMKKSLAQAISRGDVPIPPEPENMNG